MKKLLQLIFGVGESEEDIRQCFRDEHEAFQQQEAEVEHEEYQDDELKKSQIIFQVDEGGSISVHIQWNGVSEPLAESTGRLLYLINHGKIAPQCELVLNGTMKKQPIYTRFIRNVLMYWKKSIQEQEQVVKPSEVLGIGRQKSGSMMKKFREGPQK